MDRYFYFKELQADIKDYINENYDSCYFIECLNDAGLDLDDATESFIERLQEDLSIEDSITGNASGSYYCNAWKAESALAHNWDLIADMLDDGYITADTLKQGPECLDVCIRCYLLGPALWDMQEEIREYFENVEKYCAA